jgi:hypothetical protein
MTDFTESDKRACKMIGVLMMVAKLTQSVVEDTNLDIETAAENFAKLCGELVSTTGQLFPGGYQKMESEIVEFARLLGMSMEVELIHPCGREIH